MNNTSCCYVEIRDPDASFPEWKEVTGVRVQAGDTEALTVLQGLLGPDVDIRLVDIDDEDHPEALEGGFDFRTESNGYRTVKCQYTGGDRV